MNKKRKTPALMLQGTASSVGKSLLTTAFCRILLQDGFRVAPFKAQNMSNNSWVTLGGEEIARSQVVQAQAAKLEPDARMNPILLKPLSNMESQVVYCGKAVGNYAFGKYTDKHDEYFRKVCECYDSLAKEHDVIVLEGAGCSAEVNLKSRDLVNMKMARHAEASVLIVGDIDRGGVFAAFVGMMHTFEDWERELVKGFIVNRFRGDASLLDDAYQYIDEHLDRPVLGTVPMIPALKIPEEDGVQFSENVFDDQSPLGERIDIALIGLHHISNYNDLDPLRFETDVRMRIVRTSDELGSPDLVIIPGTRNVIRDLSILKESGLAAAFKTLRQNRQIQIVGLCGGFQMLGRVIHDPHGVESEGISVEGLDFLDAETTLEQNKTLSREIAMHVDSSREVFGYRIHHGVTVGGKCRSAVISSSGETLGLGNPDQNVWGTYLHGIFDDDIFRRWFIDEVRVAKGLSARGGVTSEYSLEREFDRLADAVRASVDLNRIYETLDLNA